MKYVIEDKYKNAKLVQGLSTFMPIYGDDEDKVIQTAEDTNTYIENLKEDIMQRGGDSITVLDVLDTERMMENASYDEKTMEALNHAILKYEQSKNILLFDIKPNFNDNVSLLRASYRLSKIMDKIIVNLYREFKYYVYPEEREADEGFSVLFKVAFEDLAEEYLRYNKFCAQKGYAFDKDNPEVKEEHSSEYYDWRQEAIDTAVETMYNNPFKPCFVAPNKLKEFKEVLKTMCPFEFNEYVDNLNANDIIGPAEVDNFKNVINSWKISDEQLKALSAAYQDLFKWNVIYIMNEDLSEEGLKDPRKNKPLFGSITLQEVLFNMIIVASGDVLNLKEDENYQVIPSTKYLLDAIQAELIKDMEDIAEVGEFASYKLLSIYRMLINSYTTTSTIVRYSTAGWNIANQKIANLMMIEDNITKEKILGTEDTQYEAPERVNEGGNE